MRAYTSDINKEQFQVIRDDLENFKKTTRPRKIDLYDIFCGVLYILTTGAQWRNLPTITTMISGEHLMQRELVC